MGVPTREMTVLESNNSKRIIRVLTSEDAKRLSDYLPVRLRDFWLVMHPLAQAYLYDQSSCPEEFFVLVDMEFARFTRMNMSYNRKSNMWENVATPIEKILEFKLEVDIPELTAPEKR